MGNNARALQILCVCTLVGSNGLVNPAAQVGHTGVHGRGTHVAVRGAPGHNTHKGPHSTVLTDQRATGVTLTGGHSRSTGTDHGISDSVITPVLLALSRAEQRQAGLLEVAGA